MKNNFTIYSLLIVYLIVNTFFLVPMSLDYYNELINPLIWMAICGVSVFLNRDSSLRIKGEQDKTQSLLIALIVYIIIYFSLGLLFGFQNTPYSKEILAIIRNIWSFGSIVFFEEYTRESLIKGERKKLFNYVLTTIMFIIINLSYTNFSAHFVDLKSTFIYIVSIIIPAVLESVVLTYLVHIGGAKLSIIYRLFIIFPPLFVPIIPNLDWFVTAIIGVALPVAIYVYLNYINVNKSPRLSRREKAEYNPIVYTPTVIVIILALGFVIGVFKYQPVAILSGSMSPTFNRGDAVVVNKLTTSEKSQLKKGDIIQFVSGTKYVVHRIIKVTNDTYGNKAFITKGDHNNIQDYGQVQMENIKGKVSFVIPYIGYPSVWLSGAMS